MNGTNALILAVPSKGRLQENAAAFFARHGIEFARENKRIYWGTVPGLDEIEVAFRSAGDIAGQLAAGSVHLGVTGRDLVEETIDDWKQRVELVAPLGFGFADVVVAVPDAWIDVETMADLDDVAGDFRRRHGRRLKVATKYFNLTQRFFAGHGIADYRVVESVGATEGAPAAGVADLIVDITTSRETLKANRLKELRDGTILRSEAHLVASLTAAWTDAARAGLDQLAARMGIEGDAGGLAALVRRVGG